MVTFGKQTSSITCLNFASIRRTLSLSQRQASSQSTIMTGASKPCGPLAPAPYGQACIGCVRAKCKCFYQFGEAECERSVIVYLICSCCISRRKRPSSSVKDWRASCDKKIALLTGGAPDVTVSANPVSHLQTRAKERRAHNHRRNTGLLLFRLVSHIHNLRKRSTTLRLFWARSLRRVHPTSHGVSETCSRMTLLASLRPLQA